jgi:hypothetical protein
MNTYLEQLEAMEEDKRQAMSMALLDTMFAIVQQLSGFADNRPVVVSDKDEYSNPNNKAFMMDRLMCLKWLAEGAAIIELKYLDEFEYIPFDKRLFKALFLAAPNTIDRETVERIAGYGHKDDPIKYAVNDAFSSLRKACGGVDKTVITQVGGYKLNAKVFPLSFQLFQNTYGNQKIRPKKQPK